MRGIQVFIEGGGEDADLKTRLRRGFGLFFTNARTSCKVTICGPRDEAFKRWKSAVTSHPEVLNLLLIDSEGPIATGTPPHLHLRGSDKSWKLPSGFDQQLHLMVQMMEAWFLADPEVLAVYYGQRFGAKALPGRQNVEEIPKAEVESSLKNATKRTQKGEYHKIRHASDLLARIDPAKVRKRAPHCDSLLGTLAKAQAEA